MADTDEIPLPSFADFLTKKKVDAKAFATARPAEYTRYADAYAQQGPISFDHSAKFLFNDWRLDFPLGKEG